MLTGQFLTILTAVLAIGGVLLIGWPLISKSLLWLGELRKNPEPITKSSLESSRLDAVSLIEQLEVIFKEQGNNRALTLLAEIGRTLFGGSAPTVAAKAEKPPETTPTPVKQ